MRIGWRTAAYDVGTGEWRATYFSSLLVVYGFVVAAHAAVLEGS